MAAIDSAIAFGKEDRLAAGKRKEKGASPQVQSQNRSTVPSAPPNSGVHCDLFISAARAGDELAFQGLVEAHGSTAARLAHTILKTEEAAADAVQDALIKVYHAMPRFQDGNFRAWLLRIVANTCYDHLRYQKRQPAVSLDQLLEDSRLEVPDCRIDQDPERRALHQEQLALLSRMIRQLPAWYRDVVILVDIHGYDYGEAAAYLDLPLGTVKSRLSRARANLRESTGGLGSPPTAAILIAAASPAWLARAMPRFGSIGLCLPQAFRCRSRR